MCAKLLNTFGCGGNYFAKLWGLGLGLRLENKTTRNLPFHPVCVRGFNPLVLRGFKLKEHFNPVVLTGFKFNVPRSSVCVCVSVSSVSFDRKADATTHGGNFIPMDAIRPEEGPTQKLKSLLCVPFW
jgi:hypothetical protein